MTTSSHSNLRFFERARVEARRYGSDPWVLLRELVQNSRDAGASQIHFSATESGGIQSVTCTDDGAGMTRAHIERYLFRLFASDKEDHEDLIGFFGVGFWSILLFQPKSIRIESSQGTQSTAFEIDCTTDTVHEIRPQIGHRGTRISLNRPSPKPSGDNSFAREVQTRLSRFAAHVRPVNGSKSVNLLCNGVLLNRPFEPPQYLARPLRGREFDGVIGFGESPYVRIYQGGLLVRETGSLDDLLPNRPTNSKNFNEGVYPQISINCDRLRLLMDRKGIFEDRHLLDLVKTSESALEGMHRILLQESFPIDGRNRWYLFRRWFRLSWLVSAAILVILGLLAFPYMGRFSGLFERPYVTSESSRSRVSAPREPSKPRTVDTIGQSLRRTIVDGRNSDGPIWDLQTDAESGMVLQVGVLTQYDSMNGFFFTSTQLKNPYPAISEGLNPVHISLELSGSRSIFVMPHPPGGHAVAASVQLNGTPIEKIYEDAFGQPVLTGQNPLKGTLTYDVIPLSKVPNLSKPSDIGASPQNWPSEIAGFLTSIAASEPSLRRESIRRFVTQNFSYTRNPNAASNGHLQTSWIEKVWQSRAGDCDVINGFHVLLLRASGIPAHLAVGLVINDGRVSPTLHAWTMVHDGSWRHVDITESIPPQGPLVAEAQTRPKTPAPIVSPSPERVTDEENPFRFLSPATIRRFLLSVAQSRTLSFLVVGIAIIFILGIFLWSRKNRHRLPRLDPKYLELLMKKSINSKDDRDPLNLRFRPMFRTLTNRRASIAELEKWSLEDPLMSATPGSRISTLVHRRRRVLDSTCTSLTTLQPFLPPMVNLDAHIFTLAPPALPDFLQNAQNVLRTLDPKIRLHPKHGGDSVEEICIPFRKKHLGTIHFVVGLNAPAVTASSREYATRPDLATFHLLEWLLTHTTTYWRARDASLSRWANQLLSRTNRNS